MYMLYNESNDGTDVGQSQARLNENALEFLNASRFLSCPPERSAMFRWAILLKISEKKTRMTSDHEEKNVAGGVCGVT